MLYLLGPTKLDEHVSPLQQSSSPKFSLPCSYIWVYPVQSTSVSSFNRLYYWAIVEQLPMLSPFSHHPPPARVGLWEPQPKKGKRIHWVLTHYVRCQDCFE